MGDSLKSFTQVVRTCIGMPDDIFATYGRVGGQAEMVVIAGTFLFTVN